MIDYARVSNMVRYIEEKRLWAEWQYATRCWEYPWILEKGCFEKGHICLDAGCGQAPFLSHLYGLGCEPHGLDYIQGEKADYPGSYGIPRDWINLFTGMVQYHHGSMFEAPFSNNTFDRITCISVLEHILSPRQPHAHYPCLRELRRILKPGGLLIMTVDYFVNSELTPGYDYLDDIAYLEMPLFDRSSHRWTREEISLDEDAYFVPPQMYLEMGYGRGFNKKVYHRLTSIGYILRKPK